MIKYLMSGPMKDRGIKRMIGSGSGIMQDNEVLAKVRRMVGAVDSRVNYC